MDKREETSTASTCDLARRYSELQRLRNLVQQAEKNRTVQPVRTSGSASSYLSGNEREISAAPLAALDRSLSVNIFNSKGIHVGVVSGASIFDLGGQKLYRLRG
jgi:hypothetical protein